MLHEILENISTFRTLERSYELPRCRGQSFHYGIGLGRDAGQAELLLISCKRQLCFAVCSVARNLGSVPEIPALLLRSS